MDALSGGVLEDGRPTAAAVAEKDAEFTFDSIVDDTQTTEQEPAHGLQADTAAVQDSLVPHTPGSQPAAVQPLGDATHLPKHDGHMLAEDGDDVLGASKTLASTTSTQGLDGAPMFGTDATVDATVGTDALVAKDAAVVAKDAAVVAKDAAVVAKDAIPGTDTPTNKAVVNIDPTVNKDPVAGDSLPASTTTTKPQSLPSSDTLSLHMQPSKEDARNGGQLGTSDSLFEEPAVRHANRHKPSWQQHAHGYG